MPAQDGPENLNIRSATDILRNEARWGVVLSPDVDIDYRLPTPNADLQRAELTEREGLLRVNLRLDANDLGKLLFAGAGEKRMEEALSESEIGAIVLSNIVEDAFDIKSCFESSPAGSAANLSVKLHHHEFTDEEVDHPEFFISPEYRNHCQKSFVELSWSAHVPPQNDIEHTAPIALVNALVQVLKDSGYERHWKTAIARFHPGWDRERDNTFVQHLESEERALMPSAGIRVLPDLSDLRGALRRELNLKLEDPRAGLGAYVENHSLIRIRLPLNDRVIDDEPLVEYLAEEMHRELTAAVLDGGHMCKLSRGGKIHVLLEYYFKSAASDEFRKIEVAAAHRELYLVVESHRSLFAGRLD